MLVIYGVYINIQATCQREVLGIVILFFLFTVLIAYSAAKTKAARTNPKMIIRKIPIRLSIPRGPTPVPRQL